MRTQAMSKLRGESPSPPFSRAPKSSPEDPFVIMPVLGHPSFEESYPSLANKSSAQGQAGWSKGGRGGALAREISIVSLVAYGPKVFYSALAMGGYSFWNQAGWFPAGDKKKCSAFRTNGLIFYNFTYTLWTDNWCCMGCDEIFRKYNNLEINPKKLHFGVDLSLLQ